MALWLRWGVSAWPGMLLGAAALLADPASSRPLLLALMAGDLCARAVGVWGLRRAGVNPRLERRGDVGLLLALSLVAAALGALVSVAGWRWPAGRCRMPCRTGCCWACSGRWIGALLAARAVDGGASRGPARGVVAGAAALELLLLGSVLASAPRPSACRPNAAAAAAVGPGLRAGGAGVGAGGAWRRRPGSARAAATLSLGVGWAGSLGPGAVRRRCQPSQPLAPTWAYAAALVGALLLVHVLPATA